MLISFEVDGTNCWKHEDIKVALVKGSSNYKVTVEGTVREDDIICQVPSSQNLITFLARLLNGAIPVFKLQSESENFNPMDKCD